MVEGFRCGVRWSWPFAPVSLLCMAALVALTLTRPVLAQPQPQAASGAPGADQKAIAGDGGQGASAKKGRVVTISEVTIVGRIQKPIAAVDVSRIQPRLTLRELRQPFLSRIREAAFRAPF